VLQKLDHSVAFYSAEGQLLETVPVGQYPHEMILSPDGQLAYVTDYGALGAEYEGEGGTTVSIIDVAEQKKSGTIDLANARRPHGLDIDEYMINPFFFPYDSFALVEKEGEQIKVRLFNEEWEEDYREITYEQESCTPIKVEYVDPDGLSEVYNYSDWQFYIDISTADFESDPESYKEKGWTVEDIR
jgi:hypothetical protein